MLKNMVGISFDDGPNQETIKSVLDTLLKYECQATFFWINDYAIRFSKENNYLFQKSLKVIKKAGHEVGLHAPCDYSPSLINRMTSKFSKKELLKAKTELEELIEQEIKLYRPHYFIQPISWMHVRNLGMTFVSGNLIHYAEPDAPVDVQVKKFSSANMGDTLVFHDGLTIKRKTTLIVDVLPVILKNLKERGLKPTKISNLLVDKSTHP